MLGRITRKKSVEMAQKENGTMTYKLFVKKSKSDEKGVMQELYDLSLEAICSGLRMSLASAFNEHEYFSLDDVMAITGENREELLQRIEQCRQELIEAGENPDDYFKPVEPQKAAVYYFPDGNLFLNLSGDYDIV